jgi:hypothetical protein
MRSNIHRNLGAALILCSFSIMSCQESGKQSDAAKADSAIAQGADTSVNGLEGTRDQQGSLSTDVRTDTSSGQSANTDQNKKPSGSK